MSKETVSATAAIDAQIKALAAKRQALADAEALLAKEGYGLVRVAQGEQTPEPPTPPPPPPPPPPKGDDEQKKRDRSSRKGKPLGPISQVLDFSYADKKEALVFILCGASYDNRTVPSYNFPAQVYDNQGTRAKVPPGHFILPKFLVDKAKIQRKDKVPTVFSPDEAKLIEPPDIMLRDFADALELPYTWVMYLFTIQVEKIPKALRLVERRTATTWKMTPLAWNAFTQRNLAHIRTLAGHFSRMVRSVYDPNAWTQSQLEKPMEDRPKIDKAHAVTLARKVRVDQAMINRAYEDLKIPANLRDPVKQEELAASVAALQEPGD
jgi:hypothetical protein